MECGQRGKQPAGSSSGFGGWSWWWWVGAGEQGEAGRNWVNLESWDSSTLVCGVSLGECVIKDEI